MAEIINLYDIKKQNEFLEFQKFIETILKEIIPNITISMVETEMIYSNIYDYIYKENIEPKIFFDTYKYDLLDIAIMDNDLNANCFIKAIYNTQLEIEEKTKQKIITLINNN